MCNARLIIFIFVSGLLEVIFPWTVHHAPDTLFEGDLSTPLDAPRTGYRQMG